MAENDIAEKTFISLNDVFADIFNVLVFSGKQVVLPDSLEDVLPFSQYKAEDAKLHEQERDTHKLWHGHGINLVLVGIENQTQPDKDMPFRVFSYDGASYRSQLLKTEERMINGELKQMPVKERYPVVTIVLYFGKELWKYPKKLTECFYPPLPDDEVSKMLKKYIQDYRVHVFDIPRLSRETVRKFRSDFRIVADYFVHAYTNAEYMPDNSVITHVDEFLKLMKVLTGDIRYEEISLSFTETEKEGMTMCNVLDAREARGKAEGRIEGRIEGEARMSQLVSILISLDKYAELKEIASNPKLREEYYTLYNI